MTARTRPSAQPGFMNGVLSIRGIFAILVASSHTLGFTAPYPYMRSLLEQETPRDMVLKFFLGTINVPMVFFVISGIAIARSLARKEATHRRSAHKETLRAYGIFMLRRVLRLYPAQLVAVSAITAAAALGVMRQSIDLSAQPALFLDDSASWLSGAVFNPLRWQSVLGNAAIASWSMNPVTWTLYVEVCAIPILPLFYALSRRKSLWLDGVLMALLCSATMVLGNQPAFQFWFAFYLGMLVETHGKAYAQWLGRHCGIGGALALSVATLYVPGLQPIDWPPSLLLQALGAFSLICLVVWCEESRIFRCLDAGILKWSGRVSYSFYLWHFFLLTVAVRLSYLAIEPLLLAAHPMVFFLAIEGATVALALAVGHLSYRWIETPFITWGQRLERRWRRPRASAVSQTVRPSEMPAVPDATSGSGVAIEGA